MRAGESLVLQISFIVILNQAPLKLWNVLLIILFTVHSRDPVGIRHVYVKCSSSVCTEVVDSRVARLQNV